MDACSVCGLPEYEHGYGDGAALDKACRGEFRGAEGEREQPSRWVLLRRKSNSGCNLFLCLSCERVSKTPDKACNDPECAAWHPGDLA